MSDTLEFKPWPKTPRLRRNCIITEKIDGTNAQILIAPDDDLDDAGGVRVTLDGPVRHIVKAGSRKRWITPQADNFGFADWVWDNALDLARLLGPGRHYGEWWGQGIQRNYGLDHRTFSIFNVARWNHRPAIHIGDHRIDCVPVLAEATFSDDVVQGALDALRAGGSRAADWPHPEGICVYHTQSRQVYKVLLENDATPKSVAMEVAA